jgi:hypothetical protein
VLSSLLHLGALDSHKVMWIISRGPGHRCRRERDGYGTTRPLRLKQRIIDSDPLHSRERTERLGSRTGSPGEASLTTPRQLLALGELLRLQNDSRRIMEETTARAQECMCGIRNLASALCTPQLSNCLRVVVEATRPSV